MTKDDANVITWGNEKNGGDSSQVLNKLNENIIETIYSTNDAFLAVTDERMIITWGNPAKGGDSSEVSNLLNENTINVKF